MKNPEHPEKSGQLLAMYFTWHFVPGELKSNLYIAKISRVGQVGHGISTPLNIVLLFKKKKINIICKHMGMSQKIVLSQLRPEHV